MGKYVMPFNRARQAGAPQVGGKATRLGALLEAGFPVPPAPCLTTAAFRLALDPWLDRVNAILRQHDHDRHGLAGAVGCIRARSRAKAQRGSLRLSEFL